MIFPIEYSDCFLLDNDDCREILKQLENGNIFKANVNDSYKFGKELCCFKARVNSKSNVEFYWLTNDERRSFVKKLQSILNNY